VQDHPLLAVDDLIHVKAIRSAGRFDITCPWVDEHTGAADNGTAVFTNADGSIGFKCHHGACQERTGADLLALVEEHAPGFGARLKSWQTTRALADVADVSFIQAPAVTTDPIQPLLDAINRTPPGDDQRRIAAQLLKAIDQLPRIDQNDYHKRVCDLMHWSKKELAGILQDLRADWYGDADELDQLQLAHRIIENLDAGSIIADSAGVWSWQSTGVWRSVEDRALRQMVQRQLSGMIQRVNATTVNSVAELLRNQIYTPGHQWNQGHSESVNCLNGELVLTNGRWQLHPHSRDHYRTIQTPVQYDPSADCPRFRQFMLELFNGDPDCREKSQAVLEMMGYSLMSHARYERFALLVGNGSNGKSVLMKVVEALTGAENVAAVQPGNFDKSPQRARLKDKLVNIVTELKQGEVIDDAGMKAITSGETMTVDHKFGHPFEMQPFCTLWIGTNHMPHTKDFSDGLFRRALVIPFNNRFTPETGNCDPLLVDKLKAELPGILNAALQAYAVAVTGGFTMPTSTTDARKAWRMEADQVMQFVDEQCETAPGTEVPVSNLYDAYRVWCSVNGIRQPLKSRKFGERLEMMGYPAKKGTGGVRYRSGLQIL
jgi:putative DNA primase/helicase